MPQVGPRKRPGTRGDVAAGEHQQGARPVAGAEGRQNDPGQDREAAVDGVEQAVGDLADPQVGERDGEVPRDDEQGGDVEQAVLARRSRRRQQEPRRHDGHGDQLERARHRRVQDDVERKREAERHREDEHEHVDLVRGGEERLRVRDGEVLHGLSRPEAIEALARRSEQQREPGEAPYREQDGRGGIAGGGDDRGDERRYEHRARHGGERLLARSEQREGYADEVVVPRATDGRQHETGRHPCGAGGERHEQRRSGDVERGGPDGGQTGVDELRTPARGEDHDQGEQDARRGLKLPCEGERGARGGEDAVVEQPDEVDVDRQGDAAADEKRKGLRMPASDRGLLHVSSSAAVSLSPSPGSFGYVSAWRDWGEHPHGVSGTPECGCGRHGHVRCRTLPTQMGGGCGPPAMPIPSLCPSAWADAKIPFRG